MQAPGFDTVHLRDWLARMRAGDLSAREELLHTVWGRLERLARKMLSRFAKVRRWTQTDDVLQNALVRLLRSLQEVQPTSTREFLGLAATQVRRELLDLARHFYGPEGPGTNHGSHPELLNGSPGPDSLAGPQESPEELERWCRFHQGVEALPVEEREVVGLVYYQGWTTTQAADLMEVSERTVRRRWQSALRKLHRLVRHGEP